MSAAGDEETVQACLTPPGTGAIATLAVRGPRAWAVVRGLFERVGGKALPEQPEAGRFWLGRLGEAARGGRDEVVLAVRRGWPVPWLEIHCHGGREVVALLQEVLAAAGVAVRAWQTLPGQESDGDALRRLALEGLPGALTARTAGILLDQHAGALSRALAEVEAELARGRLPKAERLLAAVTWYGGVGRHLTRPWRVAVAGAVNVGKSSLVNALLGYERSVVSAMPGTTRDVVISRLVVDGWPVELADTAGGRDAAGELERRGQERAAGAAAGADLCLWVLDGSATPQWPGEPGAGLRCLVNKCDLPAAWDFDQHAPGCPRVSARTGAGVAELCAALACWLVPEAPLPGSAVPFTPELATRLEAARACCAEGNGDQARRLVGLCRED